MANATPNASNPSAVNTAAKDILARILAGENLVIEHNAKAHTASFDTKSRVLTLPVWDNMSETMYDMLIGHEVGHALYTPWTERDEAANGIAAAFDIGGHGNAEVAMDYLNVVEDARIEKMVQDKFPGLRRDFFSAYGEMIKTNFFGLNGEDINKMPLIDRINLHFKLGSQCPQQIIFTPDEQKFIDRMNTVTSFDDVVAVASDLFSFCGNKRNDEKREQYLDKVRVRVPSGKGDSTENLSDGNNGDGDMSDDLSDSSNGGDPNEGNQDSDSESDNPSATNGAGKLLNTPARSRTQENMQNNLNRMKSKNIRNISYFTLQTPKIDNIVWDYKKVLADFDSYLSDKRYAATLNNINREIALTMEDLNNFLKEANPLVNNMVKQFEMRKAADRAKRTSISRTGVIDTVRMMNYKMTEDIFRRNAIIADGKSHGLVMYIDWSSSMANHIINTTKQLMLLFMFCRKVNIPFEVYAFTSIPMNPSLCTTGNWGQKYSEACNYWSEPKSIGRSLSSGLGPFSLINFMSSRMNTREYNAGLAVLFRAASNAAWVRPGVAPENYSLSSTPLNEAIVAAMHMVPKFREDNKLQIVNTVFLTDGSSSHCGIAASDSYYNVKSFINDPNTRKVYEVKSVGGEYGSDTVTSTLLRIFRDNTKTNAIGFFLLGGKTLPMSSAWTDRNLLEKACAAWVDNGFAVAPQGFNGYTEQYLVRSETMQVVAENTNLGKLIPGAATVAQVTKALARDCAAKNKSKLLLNRFIDLIAK